MPKINPLPDRAFLLSLFDYDVDSGALTWRGKASRKHLPGMSAGSLHHSGYVQVAISGRLYMAHRLIWKMQTGEDPTHEVDHVNGVRSDNRWANLRAATSSQQGMNKSVKNEHRGVSFNTRTRKYGAQIKIDRRVEWLGSFPTPEDACAVYRRRSVELFGEYGKKGRCACL